MQRMGTGTLGLRISLPSSPHGPGNGPGSLSGTATWTARVAATDLGVGSPAAIAPRGQPNLWDALVGTTAAQHTLKWSGQSVRRGRSARRAPVSRSLAPPSITATRERPCPSGANQYQASTAQRKRAAGGRSHAPQEGTAKTGRSHAAQPDTTARREVRLLLRAKPVTPHRTLRVRRMPCDSPATMRSLSNLARSILAPH